MKDTSPAADLTLHHVPESLGDRVALRTVKFMRVFADAFFSKRYGHRAVVLETVAAVPGMVGGLLQHLKALRHIRDDQGWIRELLEEADNERMHLMTFIKVAQPSRFERAVIMIGQAIFYNAYFWLYLFTPRIAHRIVGYLEEEAVVSYTQYRAPRSQPPDGGRTEGGLTAPVQSPDRAVKINPAVAEQTPTGAQAGDGIKVELVDQHAFGHPVGLGDQLPGVVGNEA
jgi:ubiquinol oxidase